MNLVTYQSNAQENAMPTMTIAKKICLILFLATTSLSSYADEKQYELIIWNGDREMKYSVIPHLPFDECRKARLVFLSGIRNYYSDWTITCTPIAVLRYKL